MVLFLSDLTVNGKGWSLNAASLASTPLAALTCPYR